ncbi:hypothetical protein [Acidovorax sp. SRB_14]|uniref:hypothetical protein n=1 Tax=Acidovorax sp. SRB_14 TaxID=1962699 RepID=UPI00146DB3C0|nr:hypothetical protein [Acidovorax sp. SRB_14]
MAQMERCELGAHRADVDKYRAAFKRRVPDVDADMAGPLMVLVLRQTTPGRIEPALPGAPLP